MNPNDYQAAAMMTARAEMPVVGTREMRMLNWALGLGEVGELQNLVKKWIFHGHNQGRLDMIDELGDILWYVAVMAYDLDTSLEAVMEKNIEKLKDRYPEGFNPAASINRKETQ